MSEIPDVLEVEVPVGGRVMVAADLHLAKNPTPGQLAASSELASNLEASTGPGVLILAGNLFDTVPTGAEPPGPGAAAPAAVLGDHPRLSEAITAFARGDGRRVVVLPGDRDVRLASAPGPQETVRKVLGAELALAVDLRIATGAGERRVRVDPGYRFDALSRYSDPRNPLESPYSEHIRDQVLPSVRRRAAGENPSLAARMKARRRPAGTDPTAAGVPAGWTTGVEQLDDVGALSRFIASRLVYRRFIHFGWLILIPVIAAVVLRIPSTALSSAHRAIGTRLGLFVAAIIVELALLVLVGIAGIRVTSRALGAVALEEPGRDSNEEARARARALVTEGYAGLISAQTCRPELTHLGSGFYANAGTGADVVTEYPSRVPGLGLPSVFLPHRTLSWVEVEAGNDLHVRLLHARQDLPGATIAERLFADRDIESAGGELRPAVVATWPQGEAWPQPTTTVRRDRLVRRAAAVLLVAVGFLSLISAVSDPLNDRLNLIRRLFPLAVPETAAAITAFFGVALIVLARGVRRGQRRAWVVCQLMLIVVAVLHVIKGVDVEEAVVALGAAGLLYLYRSSFEARTDVIGLARGLSTVLTAAVLVIVAGTLGVEFSTVIDHTRHHQVIRVSWWHALQASLYRMVGDHHVAIPRRINDFLAPTMATATVGLVLALLAVLFRPVVARRFHLESEAPAPARLSRPAAAARPAKVADGSVGHGVDGLARARGVVDRHGSGTLDYFALRPDKDFFFWGDTIVAHAVYGGVCLVSPDPIGPVAEREEAWRAFRRYVDGQGWALGGLGIGEDWLPIYRASGMHDLYVGDEAVVRVDRFTLEGGRFKGLRQAVNRVAKYGYRISFHDPSALDAELGEQLKEVMTKSRRGDVERGFSMTLGRVFDEADSGLLLAVVHGPAPEGSAEGTLGPPVAFCQYVPAPGIGGYSLDLMRRDDGEHPNGLIDFAVVETIREIKARGQKGLGLNFATMRAVLAGEAGEGMTQRVQAWLLRRMGDSMQIESLWKFNAKFDPDWQPRYAIYDAPENTLAVAIAVARAESFWELPVIGRFLTPSAPKDVAPEPAPSTAQ
ncbi:MAG TPA: phosphatidylglycerol lysyltransferase domain-containing protein [Acidimicrobiales bacterium]|nr:phosphatidylglycerol lysyltransferase domain-containing protein [Acidimicrobiales bacterium]